MPKAEPPASPVLRYRVPSGTGQAELVIKGSTFIGTVARAEGVEAANAFVESMRLKYSDASHNAWAYKIDGGPQALIGSSDDGEPGGTAGRPMLSVLSGHGDLRETVVVGTRYFGGIKLGTGGLVRAYSGAAREALAHTPTSLFHLHCSARIIIDYALYGTLRYQLPRFDCRVGEEQFGAEVTLILHIPYEQLGPMGNLLQELTNGRIVLTPDTLPQEYLREEISHL